MADCQKHFFCVPANDYKPVKAATLALASLIFMVASGAVGFTPGGIVGGALWIAAVFDLCHYLHGGKLICLEKNVCAIGRVAKVHPVGSDKSGLEKMDDDFTFDLIISPHAALETKSDIIATDPNQGKFIEDQPGPVGIGLGYDGVSVTFPGIDDEGYKETEVLHCEVKGCRVHDVCIVLKVMSFPTAAAAVWCSIPFIGWISCLVALLIVAVITLIVGGIVWAATHNGALSDVMDPNAGDLVPADDKGQGGDIVLVRGDWVYDAGHAGWNEIHPVRYAQKLTIPGKFHGVTKASAALVADFKREVLDPWCYESGKTEDPLVIENQKRSENRWHIHPSIDGCKEQPVIR